MEILSRLLDDAATAGTFAYHPKCSALSLTHLVFAYNLIIFTEATEMFLIGVKNVLDSFYS